MRAKIIGPVEGGSTHVFFHDVRVPCGFPSPAQDHLEQSVSLDELLGLRAPQTYLAWADGDSMTGAGIFSGDLLVVDRSLEPRRGRIVIAAIDNEAFVKRLDYDGETIVLRSENPAYPPRCITEGDDLLIWGVVRFSVKCHD